VYLVSANLALLLLRAGRFYSEWAVGFGKIHSHQPAGWKLGG
jgi:hypothetical protein